MNLPQRIRVLAERAFERQAKAHDRIPAPDMRPFLAVPIRERLVLLALYDNRSMAEIKEAYPWAKETDVRLTSHRIKTAIDIFVAATEDPTTHIHPGPLPDHEATGDLGVGDPNDPLYTDFPIESRLIPKDTAKQLRQAFYPSVPLMLFGAHVPASVAELSLQHRAIAYLAVVEEWTWGEVQELLACSKWQVYNGLTEAVEALGG